MTLRLILMCCMVLAGDGIYADQVSSEALILEGVIIVDVEKVVVVGPKSILIERGRIVDIAPSPPVEWPSGARPEVAKLYLSPALYDAHVHIFDERSLAMYALGGIQAVRNMDGWPWHLSLRTPPADTGQLQARLITVGSQLQAPDIKSAGDALSRVTGERDSGYDWVKLYDDLPEDALAGLATQPGFLVTGHLPSHIPVSEVLALAVLDDIAHAEELSHALGNDYPEGEAGLDALAHDMRASGTALTTTIVNNRMIADQVADFRGNLARNEVADAPPLLQAFWNSAINPWSAEFDPETIAGIDRQTRSLMSLSAGLHARGVVLLAGTDAPNPTTVPAHSLHQELALLVEAGLSPAEALGTATVAAADHLEPGKRGARIEPGASANFILSSGNPLEDVGVLARYDGLVIDGKWVSRESAEVKKTKLRDEYAKDLAVLRNFAPDSPAGVFEAMASAGKDHAISSAALTSLVWFYMKIGNLDAASAVAERLIEAYPSPRSEAIQAYIAKLASG